MKVKELIVLLSNQDQEANVYVNTNNNPYDISSIEVDDKVVKMVADKIFLDFEIDEDIAALIRWREEPTDYWGEDLLGYIVHNLNHDRISEYPEQYKAPTIKFRQFNENTQYLVVRKVLNIKEGEGYASY